MTTFTSDDVKTLFALLYKLEQRFEDHDRPASEAETTQIIRKLNAMGIK